MIVNILISNSTDAIYTYDKYGIDVDACDNDDIMFNRYCIDGDSNQYRCVMIKHDCKNLLLVLKKMVKIFFCPDICIITTFVSFN